ncbi:hypothetical protein LguiA_036715 [Lonicera macranthoides]
MSTKSHIFQRIKLVSLQFQPLQLLIPPGNTDMITPHLNPISTPNNPIILLSPVHLPQQQSSGSPQANSPTDSQQILLLNAGLIPELDAPFQGISFIKYTGFPQITSSPASPASLLTVPVLSPMIKPSATSQFKTYRFGYLNAIYRSAMSTTGLPAILGFLIPIVTPAFLLRSVAALKTAILKATFLPSRISAETLFTVQVTGGYSRYRAGYSSPQVSNTIYRSPIQAIPLPAASNNFTTPKTPFLGLYSCTNLKSADVQVNHGEALLPHHHGTLQIPHSSVQEGDSALSALSAENAGNLHYCNHIPVQCVPATLLPTSLSAALPAQCNVQTDSPATATSGIAVPSRSNPSFAQGSMTSFPPMSWPQLCVAASSPNYFSHIPPVSEPTAPINPTLQTPINHSKSFSEHTPINTGTSSHQNAEDSGQSFVLESVSKVYSASNSSYTKHSPTPCLNRSLQNECNQSLIISSSEDLSNWDGRPLPQFRRRSTPNAHTFLGKSQYDFKSSHFTKSRHNNKLSPLSDHLFDDDGEGEAWGHSSEDDDEDHNFSSDPFGFYSLVGSTQFMAVQRAPKINISDSLDWGNMANDEPFMSTEAIADEQFEAAIAQKFGGNETCCIQLQQDSNSSVLNQNFPPLSNINSPPSIHQPPLTTPSTNASPSRGSVSLPQSKEKIQKNKKPNNLPLHKIKKMSKAAKKELNAFSR